MATFIALLRAVNVGGTGKLPMDDLKSMCADAGFDRIRTYIASGNVVFDSHGTAARVQSALESRLLEGTGRSIPVLVRTPAEMRAVHAANPFAGAHPGKVYVFFLANQPAADATTHVLHRADEELHAGKRELYVHYPRGMGQSKLAIPAARQGTARNMNTVARLVAMTGTP